MKVLILGHGRHGKDTVGEMLETHFGLKSISSSRYALEEAVWPVMRLTHGYKDMDECFEDRSNHRELWYTLIKMYNTPDKSRLVKGLLENHDVYTGLRCNEEYAVAKEYFDLIIWVDAADRLPLEESMKIEYDLIEMIVLDNNHDLNYLEHQVTNRVGQSITIMSEIDEQE